MVKKSVQALWSTSLQQSLQSDNWKYACMNELSDPGMVENRNHMSIFEHQGIDMLKILIQTSLTGVFILFFVTACADENPQANTPAKQADQHVNSSGDQAQGIMDQPVDFSTPEAIEESLQQIAEKDGEKSREAVERSLKSILSSNPYIGGNKNRLYESMNGKTPRQIIAIGKK